MSDPTDEKKRKTVIRNGINTLIQLNKEQVDYGLKMKKAMLLLTAGEGNELCDEDKDFIIKECSTVGAQLFDESRNLLEKLKKRQARLRNCPIQTEKVETFEPKYYQSKAESNASEFDYKDLLNFDNLKCKLENQKLREEENESEVNYQTLSDVNINFNQMESASLNEKIKDTFNILMSDKTPTLTDDKYENNALNYEKSYEEYQKDLINQIHSMNASVPSKHLDSYLNTRIESLREKFENIKDNAKRNRELMMNYLTQNDINIMEQIASTHIITNKINPCSEDHFQEKIELMKARKNIIQSHELIFSELNSEFMKQLYLTKYSTYEQLLNLLQRSQQKPSSTKTISKNTKTTKKKKKIP
ncbi:hypothetical protein SNEBB_000331 [Seison nebaliae]|nr:hypothetical protein SNEBB_000331 [Seison nebaliae]